MKASDTFERLVPRITPCKHRDCLVCADQMQDIEIVRRALESYEKMAEVCRLIDRKWLNKDFSDDRWLHGKLKTAMRGVVK